MVAKPPPTATTILATPIGNVEDSRTQRLQRQQSRFRDRGGIFVPSSRNTLADILLGKASPIKRRRRSASVSPSKGRGKLNSEQPKSLVRATSVQEENLRRSPRKQRRSFSVASGAVGNKPISVVSSHSGSKALSASRRASVTRDTPTNVTNEVDDNSTSVKGASGKKTPASRRAKKSTSSKAKIPKSKLAGNHEENAPPPKRTRANAKISSADLMDGHASEPKPSEAVSSVASSSKASSVKPSNSKKASRSIPIDDEGYEEEGAPKSRRKKSAAKKSQSPSSNKKSSSKSSAPSKQSKSRAGAPQLPVIMEEDEDDALPPPSTIPSRDEDNHNEPTTRKKRLLSVEDMLTDPDDRPRKRAKPARKDVTVKKEKTKATLKPQITPDEEPSPVPSKRRRVVEQDADADADGKVAKRKKVVSESDEVDNPPLKPKKNVAKTRTKSTPKAQKPTADKAPTKTAKRKENSVALTRLETPRDSVPPRRGLPKSILLRLQNSSAPHVLDDEPDPIDFLS